MRVHYLQHVAFENLASIEDYARAKNWRLSVSHLYRGDALPPQGSFDGLIIMGGPMGIYDETEFPWLAPEKEFIRQTIEQGKWVLGICLGAQLIASVLGAEVAKGRHREIGWYPVTKIAARNESPLSAALPDNFHAFHWHQDTFSIPEGAVHLCASEGCENQGFIYRDRVVALQFHLETTPESAAALIEHCADEMDASQYVQSASEILDPREKFAAINALMHQLLDELCL